MWTDRRTKTESLEILGTLARECSYLGGPICAQFHKLLREGRYLELINFEFEYSTYECDYKTLMDLRWARQIQAFYSKSDFLDLGIDKEAVAWTKFCEAEETCLWTNRKLAYLRRKPQFCDSTLSSIIHIAQRKIAKVLGELPELEHLPFAFGPGANTTVQGHSSSARLKLGAKLSCSENFLPSAADYLSDCPQWASVHNLTQDESHWVVEMNVTPGKLVFVPKNSKTHRSIIVEPLLNSFFQKGFGSYIRDRLKFYGVDLTDQTYNQDLARFGSLTGDLATLDLSSASDTISKELIFELLPHPWAEALDSLCTRNVLYKGEVFRLEKFSSMGNGFTFELESLVFWALAKAVCSVRHIDSTLVNVFGDDIIVPVRADALLRKTLRDLGFIVNDGKSFSSGPFRESCGADFFNGTDIRPFYQKSLISDRTLYTMHNWFIRKGTPGHLSLAETILKFIRGEKLWGPDGYGDGHLLCTGEEPELKRNRSLKRAGWSGGYFDTFTLKPRRNARACSGDVAFPTYSVYTRSGEASPTDPDIVRGSKGYAKISVYKIA